MAQNPFKNYKFETLVLRWKHVQRSPRRGREVREVENSRAWGKVRVQSAGERGQGEGPTLWFLPCLSRREMMDLMWFSWMMFSTSGLSIRTQYSTSRIPVQMAE